jgi:hypothetical protein
MIQTVEATIDEKGRVNLLEPVRLPFTRRALVTILEEGPAVDADLAPARTQAEMAAAHRSRRKRLASGKPGYVSIELPFVDDGADW